MQLDLNLVLNKQTWSVIEGVPLYKRLRPFLMYIIFSQSQKIY